MMKCMECSYSTDDNEKKFCPYDGSELVNADEDFDESKIVEIDEDEWCGSNHQLDSKTIIDILISWKDIF